MSRETVLITAEALSERLGSVVLLDVGGASRGEGIAGTIAVALGDFAGAPGGLRGARPLPDLADLQARVRGWGVDDDSEVVLYDDSAGSQAARGWWTLRWGGVRRVRLLDGGLAAAKAAGLPLGVFAAPARQGSATLSGDGLPVLSADEAADHANAARLLDARGANAFNGDARTGEGGHIPGAINLPSSASIDDTGRFLPTEALRQRLQRPEGASATAFGVSCGSGVSAAHLAAAFAILGETPALYVGSWSAWTADAERPVSYRTPAQA